MKSLYICVIKLLILQHLWGFTRVTASSTGPCIDFYEYACSNYSQENPDDNYKEITQKLDYEMNKKLVEHMGNQTITTRNKQKFCDKMHVYLDSCTRETERDLKKYFEEIRPGEQLSWPLLTDKKRWLEPNETFDFWSLLGQMQSYGLNEVIISHEIKRNKEGTLEIWLAPADSASSLPDDTILEILLKTLGIEQTKMIIQRLKGFDMKWQRLSNSYTTNDIIQKLEDIDGLQPQYNVKLYLKNLLGREFENVSNITIENPEYFKFLQSKYWHPKELENLCNYLMLQFLYYLAQDSAAEFTPISCMKDLRRKFDLAANFYYYHNFYQYEETEFQKAVDQLITQIKQTMNKYFERNFLKLNCSEIIYLQTKLKGIKINIGNLPIDNRNHYFMENYYRAIPPLDKENYFKNHLLLLKHRFSKSLVYMPNQTYYVVSDNYMGGVSSPYYVPQQNMVVIPFASLQLPLFHYTHTPLQQLSLFGFVLAHELTHAFDTIGLNFDEHGLLLDPPLDIMNRKMFTRAHNCMQLQDSTESIDERIADLFAVRVVYRIYFENYPKYRLWARRFFESMAQFFCGKDNIKFVDHDSDTQRLQQIVKNFRPFARAFSCPKNSPMHPKPKCRLY